MNLGWIQSGRRTQIENGADTHKELSRHERGRRPASSKARSLSLTSFLVLFFVLASVSCSRSKTISRAELRSDVLGAISLASETELFTNQLQEGRVTAAFAKGHFEYSFKEATRSANELRQGYADSRIAGALENCHAQLESLATLLGDLKEKPFDKERLSAASQQAARIRMILQHAKEEL
jgi:hypothetical protein